RVVDSVENDKVASWYNGTRSIVLAVQRQPGTNTVEVVREIKKILPTFQKQIPAAVNMEILFDRSQPIQESVNDVQFTLVLTICLVVLVIFLFLRNISATVIPSLAVPLSLVATFGIMLLLNYSLDNLSLMALTLAVGFVVDDAVVMLENIVRHMEMGESRFQAALNGSKEIGFTILSMTLSLVAVFIPIMFMSGILGRLFREFAVTMTVAILASGFISLSLTPMLCSRFLRSPHHEQGEMASRGNGKNGHSSIQKPKSKRQNWKSRLYDASERVFDGMLAVYDWSLKISLKYHRTTMVISAAILVATVYLFMIVPKGFIPNGDTGQLNATTQAAQDISFDEMVKHQQAVARIIQKDPNVEGSNSSVGAGGPNAAANSGRIFIRLKPPELRQVKPNSFGLAHLSADEVVQKLRPKVSKIPGIKVFLSNPPAINIGGQQTKAQYQFTLSSASFQDLAQNAPALEEKLRQLPQLQDVNSDLEVKNPQVQVQINRDQASAYGLTANQIETALNNAYGSRQVSTILAPEDQYQVIMGLDPQYQQDPSALELLYIRSNTGQVVPLNAVATITKGVGPLTISHLGQLSAVTISFNLKPGISLSDVTGVIEKTARETLPATISTSFQGSAQAFQSSIAGLGLLLLVAILVIYIVLGILYENFIHPITILSSLPSAGFGALLTLMLFHVDLNIYAFVGIILLVGIVKKNGIMMIDFAVEAQQKEGKSPYDAIYEACLVRFRPIMMTTMAALMGTLPIALGFGAGAEARRPLGLAVVGGLLFSQLLTLYITPVFYTYMEAFRKGLEKQGVSKRSHIVQAGKNN
ncbi:efflux RND transporter permease subunit, partial [Allocoleopsis sp.]|uniref:efflux RND transporter permease subunit n=1 Tax=Allocoleopsis sp. TaxID=3088169 RepID=UPI002FD425A8